jgi:hypothetical protein
MTGHPSRPPGILLIVLATSVAGIVGLHLTIDRARTAQRMGQPTRRYWLAWAIPFAFWLAAVIYVNVPAHWLPDMLRSDWTG